MTLQQILVLAVIQGLTEFLPVSSSAHLILGSKLLGWPDQGLVFDVATHVGTLFAVLAYFRREIGQILLAWARPVSGAEQAFHRHLGKCLVIASIPVIAAGALVHQWVAGNLRDVAVIAASTLGFGLLLWLADARSPRDRTVRDIRLTQALLIGAGQVFSLIPGASRSGVTIMVGRMLGFSAEAAARFSFLLAIPVIAAAGAFGVNQMVRQQAAIDWAEFALAVVAAALAGWVCIAVFLSLLRRIGLLPFIIYRLVLGLALLAFVI
jgi:undecaprenyl-diphosphatase